MQFSRKMLNEVELFLRNCYVVKISWARSTPAFHWRMENIALIAVIESQDKVFTAPSGAVVRRSREQQSLPHSFTFPFGPETAFSFTGISSAFLLADFVLIIPGNRSYYEINYGGVILRCYFFLSHGWQPRIFPRAKRFQDRSHELPRRVWISISF